jgi:hypothetical protein
MEFLISRLPASPTGSVASNVSPLLVAVWLSCAAEP